MDQNRYENVPQKENIFLKILKMFGTYLKNLVFDFFSSFKYNEMKLAGILLAVPGVFLGFFMGIHSDVIGAIVYTTATCSEQNIIVDGQTMVNPEYGNIINYKLSFDVTGIALFLLMLSGILNIFTAVTLMGKKNLGSVILASLTTLLIIISGVFYVYSIYVYFEGLEVYKQWSAANPGKTVTYELAKELGANTIGIPTKSGNQVPMNSLYLSIASVAISIISSLVGIVLGFIKYDRTYEKVKM